MDLRRSDLSLLVTLNALLTERGVTAASRTLNLSQPAVSAQLARLRDLFGDPLLVGNAHGMALTPRAEAIQGDLRDHLASLDQLVSSAKAFDPAITDRAFTIAATDYIQQILLLPFVAQIQTRAPHASLAVIDIAHMERDGGLDRVELMIGSEQMTDPDVPSAKLLEERFMLYCRSDHPQIASLNRLDTFCRVSHALVSTSGGAMKGFVDDELAKRGLKRHVAVSIPSFRGALDLLRSTDLVSVLPSRLQGKGFPNVSSMEPPLALSGFNIVASWHPRFHVDDGHRWLRQQLRAFCVVNQLNESL